MSWVREITPGCLVKRWTWCNATKSGPAQLITHRFKFAEVPDALEFVMTHAAEAEKVLVMVQDGT